MFTLLSKAFSNLLISQEEDKLGRQQGKSIEDKSNKELNIKGRVTNINETERYGLINKEIYFDFDIVYAQEELSVGNEVIVHAHRTEKYHGWTATYVKLRQPDWPNKLQLEKTEMIKNPVPIPALDVKMDRIETVDLIVTEFNGQVGKLENNFQFYIKDGEIDFKPAVGDLLTVIIRYSNIGKEVTSWRPKEIKCLEGVITACENDCGVINDEVVFFRSLCNCRVRIFVGQKVSAMVATSIQGLFKFRAFSLCSSCTGEESEIYLKPRRSDSSDVMITNPVNFKRVHQGKETHVEIIVTNNTPSNLILLGCTFQKENRSIFFLGKSYDEGQTIPSCGSITITVHCRTEAIGQYDDFLLFEFADIIVERHVTASIVDPAQEILLPTAPFSKRYKNNGRVIEKDNLIIIPGQKFYKPTLRFTNKLPVCPIPRNLYKAIENKGNLFTIVPHIFGNLTEEIYSKKFQTLLHLEEIQVQYDIKRFDLFDAVLIRKGEYLSLEVPGLAEGRPSLVIGDKAILVPPYRCSEFGFEGCIHDVQQNNILLKFNESFHNSYDGKTYNVRFELNRTHFRRLHQAIFHAFENHDYAIFPEKIIFKNPLVQVTGNKDSQKNNPRKSRKEVNYDCIANASVKWNNSVLNWKQKEAVLRILEARCRPLPYIIFGPPGTGKTVTLVEAILQVYINIPNSKIIVCTPSNSAADLVTQRILESNGINICDFVRLNSYQRSVDSIPEFIQPFCKDKNNLEDVLACRITISTCSTAGHLYTLGLCNDFFTHVFIDEAGQLMEPESMLAVGFLDSATEGQLVMAGDPQQLGPVLRSSFSKTYGLQVSYLERIMHTALYSRNKNAYEDYGGYNPFLITMLVESYRSHPDILRFPSETFYFSQMLCCVPAERHEALSNWEELPSKGFPLIFHGVKGEELREENSPSWFNPTEVVKVASYLKQLYDYGLTPEDVGIIAPYKKQVEKIKLMLSSFGLEFCKIGSVEEFQGQERRAIIISTVRSCDEYVQFDLLYNLGFISNPKRLNVAITRAQELLIVVGNPFILSKDYFWDSFIRYCVVNKSYRGCELPLSFSQTTAPSGC